MSGDLTQMGDVLREAGRLDDAAAMYAKAVSVSDGSQLPEEVKEVTRRNHLFESARLAAARHDVPTAKAKTAEYARQVAVKKVPFEVRQQHELAGLIALEEKRASTAAQEFAQANQQDPRILYLTAIAWRDAGNAQRAASFAAKAASFNGLAFSYGYVRTKAQKITGTY